LVANATLNKKTQQYQCWEFSWSRVLYYSSKECHPQQLQYRITTLVWG